MKPPGRFGLGPFLLTLALLTSGSARDREVCIVEAVVSGLQPSHGYLQIELHSSSRTFLARDDATPFRSAKVAAETERMTLRFDGVPPGRYAFSMYQDLNDNDRLDSNLFGIPSEPFGFSNDPPILVGPPGFADASFEVAADLQIEIHLH